MKLKKGNFIRNISKCKEKVGEIIKSQTKTSRNVSLGKLFDLKSLNKTVKEYDIKTQINMKSYNDIKKENEKFSSQFSEAKKLQLKENKKTQFVSTFGDILEKYNQKGYKFKDLSLKHHLFKPSALLIDNDKIYKLNNIKDKTLLEKDYEFLEKLNRMVNKIILSIRGRTVPNITVINPEEIMKMNNKTIMSIKKQIRIEEEFIGKTQKFIDENAFLRIQGPRKNIKKRSISLKFENLSRNKISEINPKKLNSKLKIIIDNQDEQEETKTTQINNLDTKYQTRTSNFKENISKNYALLKRKYSSPKLIHQRILSSKLNNSFTTRIFQHNYLNSNRSINKEDTPIYSIKHLNKNKKISKQIENKINMKKNYELENLYQSAKNRKESFDYQRIISYFSTKPGNNFQKDLKEKMNPRNIIKYINDIKSKIKIIDIEMKNNNFTQNFGEMKINLDHIHKLNVIEEKISRLDYNYVKKVSKLEEL